jgi:hypothetical protein
MSNTCTCPKPPGGTITCSDDQLAICGYRNGQIESGCFDRPAHIRSESNEALRNLLLCNWALSIIRGIDRSDYTSIQPDELSILRNGLYRAEGTGETLRFSIPKDLDLGNVATVAVAGR